MNVKAQIKDKDGGVTEYIATVTVNNVAPVVGPITAPIDQVMIGTAITASALFNDVGVSDTHTAVWDWGDGQMSPGTVTEVLGSYSVTGSHSYTTAVFIP